LRQKTWCWHAVFFINDIGRYSLPGNENFSRCYDIMIDVDAEQFRSEAWISEGCFGAQSCIAQNLEDWRLTTGWLNGIGKE